MIIHNGCDCFLMLLEASCWKHNYQILSVSGQGIDQEDVNIYLIGVK